MYNYLDIQGYEDLNDLDKKMIRDFCSEFYCVWEYPNKRKPIRAERLDEVCEYLEEDTDKSYTVIKNILRVDLIDDSWLHVEKRDGCLVWY